MSIHRWVRLGHCDASTATRSASAACASPLGIVGDAQANKIHRRASQKPTSDLLNDFKANFPRFSSQVVGTSAADSGLVADALDVSVNPRYVEDPALDATNSNPAIVVGNQQTDNNG